MSGLCGKLTMSRHVVRCLSSCRPASTVPCRLLNGARSRRCYGNRVVSLVSCQNNRFNTTLSTSPAQKSFSIFQRSIGSSVQFRHKTTRITATESDASADSEEPTLPYKLVTFYWLTDIEDPDALVAAHKEFMQVRSGAIRVGTAQNVPKTYRLDRFRII